MFWRKSQGLSVATHNHSYDNRLLIDLDCRSNVDILNFDFHQESVLSQSTSELHNEPCVISNETVSKLLITASWANFSVAHISFALEHHFANWDYFYKRGLTLIPTLINNHMPSKVWDIPHFTIDEITYASGIKSILIKGVPYSKISHRVKHSQHIAGKHFYIRRNRTCWDGRCRHP